MALSHQVFQALVHSSMLETIDFMLHEYHVQPFEPLHYVTVTGSTAHKLSTELLLQRCKHVCHSGSNLPAASGSERRALQKRAKTSLRLHREECPKTWRKYKKNFKAWVVRVIPWSQSQAHLHRPMKKLNLRSSHSWSQKPWRRSGELNTFWQNVQNWWRPVVRLFLKRISCFSFRIRGSDWPNSCSRSA